MGNEIRTMLAIEKRLEALPLDERRRVILWLLDKAGIVAPTIPVGRAWTLEASCGDGILTETKPGDLKVMSGAEGKDVPPPQPPKAKAGK